MANTNYLHDIECVDLVYNIHEFNDMNEIEKTIKLHAIMYHFLFFTNWIYILRKMGRKESIEFPHHNI